MTWTWNGWATTAMWVFLGFSAGAAAAADPNASTEPTTQPAIVTTAPADLSDANMPEATASNDATPELIITGRKPAVERGERSIFSAQLPRDLLERPLTESPGLDTATTVVGKEEIRWLDAYSVIDALKYTPGAWTERRGRKVKEFFSVRGQRYPYPTYVLDGAWQREFHETNYFFNAATIERVEMVRSSSALLLGPGGMTGLVHIIPRTYTEQETRLDMEYGSDNTWLNSISHGNVVGDKLSYGVGVGYRHTDGPSHENAEENITNFFGRVVYKPSDPLTLSLTAYSYTGDRELQLAEPPASGTLQTRRDKYDPICMYMFVGKARYASSNRASTEITTSYAHRRLYGHRVGSDDWVERDYEYGARVIQSLKIGDNNTLRFGGMFNHWNSPTGKRYYVGRPGQLGTYSGVIVDEHDFGKLDVNVGYRLTHTRVDQFGGLNVEGVAGQLKSVLIENEWEDPLQTLTTGASYALTDIWSLHGNFAVGQIAAKPGMLDAQLNRPGNETRMKFDLGVKGQWEDFGEASLTGFYVYQKDAALLNGQKVIVNGEDFGLYENADRANYGLEFDMRTRRFDSGFQFFFNAVVMQTERKGTDGGWTRDKEVPRCVLGGGVSWLWKRIEISLMTKHVGSYENDRFLPGGSDPADLGAFTDLDAKVTYYFGKERQHSVFVGLENICNKKYSTVAGYPDEGRRFKTGLSLKF